MAPLVPDTTDQDADRITGFILVSLAGMSLTCNAQKFSQNTAAEGTSLHGIQGNTNPSRSSQTAALSVTQQSRTKSFNQVRWATELSFTRGRRLHLTTQKIRSEITIAGINDVVQKILCVNAIVGGYE